MTDGTASLSIVDAFTGRPFAGNPAAVCRLVGPRPASWMQDVAAEMNLSETAFLWPLGGAWSLRWFTPRAEVDLCGHATLAAAHVLWEQGSVAPEAPLTFETRSGDLHAVRRGERIELDFPATPATEAVPPAGLCEAIGVRPVFVGKTRFDYLLETAAEADLVAARPDFRQLAAVETRGVILTSRTDRPGFDFTSRFFAPAVGVDEDPVTGSAHCALGPYWAARLGDRELIGWQASRRGGAVHVRLAGERVALSGEAVTVLRGELLA